MHANTRKKRRVNRMIKRTVSSIFVFTVIMLLGLTLVSYSFGSLLKPVSDSGASADKIVSIPKGANSKQIGSIIADRGVIKNGLAFRIYVKYKGLDEKLQAGEYVFNTGMSTPEIVDRLVKGDTANISFTIPEGYTVKQIADKLEKSGLIDKSKFMDLVAHGDFGYDFLKGLPEGSARLEGYLYPDTYKITPSTNEKQIIDMMLGRCAREIGPEFRAKAAKLGLTVNEAVTLASVVEREAKSDEDRPKVAAVFLNRLKKGWRLESCATVQYALGTTKSRLLAKDLRVDSPYNTYTHSGLPIGPISSPGKPSLEAVINPADVDYMFFVVYEDGKHVFSRTLQEHNKAKAAYLSRLKNSKQ